jgi:hypothetical protein
VDDVYVITEQRLKVLNDGSRVVDELIAEIWELRHACDHYSDLLDAHVYVDKAGVWWVEGSEGDRQKIEELDL